MIGKCGHNLSFFVFVSTEKRQYKLQKERGSNTRKKSRHTETRRRWWSVQALTWNTMNSRDKERERHYKFIYIEMNLIALEGLVILSRFFHFISIRLEMASICSIQSEFQYALYICPHWYCNRWTHKMNVPYSNYQPKVFVLLSREKKRLDKNGM